MDDYVWQYKEHPNKECVDKMVSEIGIDPVLAKLLVQRGITNFDEAKDFFRPQLSNLHDPFLMKDMDIAVNRIIKAIDAKESILIYGDYDVDGTTSVALVYNFLVEHYDKDKLCFYVPDRYTEGYGVSFKGVDYASNNDCSLIITLDCGIKANDKVNYANEKFIDVIICDHHNTGESLPDAVAILNPKRSDCNYPFTELSGCGIGFKLINALCRDLNIDPSVTFKYLDLVAISTAADIVPMVGENRILVHFGIKIIETDPSLGIRSLLQISKLYNTNITVSNIVFKIGPRINAVGRLTKAENAVKILISKDLQFINATVKEIDQINSYRQEIDKYTTEEALKMIADSDKLTNSFSTVVYKEDWNKGIVGIVASRLTEHYYRPTVVLTRSNGVITGSARSVADFDLYSAILKCSDLLESFGGHSFAAGITILPENLEKFINKFENVVKSSISIEQKCKKLSIDSELSFAEITPKFIRILKQFGPFGPGNMQPVFATFKTINNGSTRVVGATQEHLKLGVKHEGVNIDGIAFGMAKLSDVVMNKQFNICYTIDENNFRGNISTQLMVKDIKDSDTHIEMKRYFNTVLDKRHLFESGCSEFCKK